MSRWFPHVTVAAIAIRDGRYLVVEESHKQKLVINQPAGHVEQGETLSEAVVREVQEETGWEFEPKGICGIFQFVPENGETYLRFTFFGDLISYDPEQPLDEGISGINWLNKQQLKESKIPLRSQAVLASVEQYELGTRLPLDIVNNL